ncbi:toxin-antitoxin system YwqK family antitoxin [Mucilaginibacter lutimaris]|uniref:Toxin-antitoxin system YwqK family antitoxin n=1 Tax=Mucilaginibacter lutimaris TaxID=931629 RepID=A0ABW2ZDC5_9SPHI
MKIKVTDGLNIITIGYSDIGSYLKIKRPVSLIWYDCGGSIGQYLCMMPYSVSERQLIRDKITENLYEDFTDRAEELHDILKPLFTLFENGEYSLSYSDGKSKKQVTVTSVNGSSTYDMAWYMFYPQSVNLNLSDELRDDYKKHYHSRGLESYSNDDLTSFTSSQLYDTGHSSVYIATRPFSEIDPEHVNFFEQEIKNGKRPFVILMHAYYMPEYDVSGTFILDGHHKMQAYQNLNIDPPYVIISRDFITVNEPEFDMESLADHLYPWQIKHIIENWDEKEALLPGLLETTTSKLKEYIKHGDYKEFHDNGKLKLEGHYQYDKPEGIITEWFDNGNIKAEKKYNGGMRVGIWRDWFFSGQLKSSAEYNEHGQLNGESSAYFQNGKQRSKYIYKNGNYADGYGFRRWAHTENMEYEFWYKDQILVKKISYADDGRLIRHEIYDLMAKSLISKPIYGNYYFQEDETTEDEATEVETDLGIIREREYPKTNYLLNWRVAILFIFIVIQLLRMCH